MNYELHANYTPSTSRSNLADSFGGDCHPLACRRRIPRRSMEGSDKPIHSDTSVCQPLCVVGLTIFRKKCKGLIAFLCGSTICIFIVSVPSGAQGPYFWFNTQNGTNYILEELISLELLERAPGLVLGRSKRKKNHNTLQIEKTSPPFSHWLVQSKTESWK